MLSVGPEAGRFSFPKHMRKASFPPPSVMYITDNIAQTSSQSGRTGGRIVFLLSKMRPVIRKWAEAGHAGPKSTRSRRDEPRRPARARSRPDGPVCEPFLWAYGEAHTLPTIGGGMIFINRESLDAGQTFARRDCSGKRAAPPAAGPSRD